MVERCRATSIRYFCLLWWPCWRRFWRFCYGVPTAGVGMLAAGLAGCSGLLVWNERAARAAGANIRVDLLVTIPVIAVAAIVVGVFSSFSSRRPPVAARIVGAGILAIGGIAFAGFSWRSVKTAFEIRRLNKAFDQGHRLYWEETIRCAGNLARHYGPIEHRDQPCRGNLVVTSRGANTYPFSRAIVNDEGQFYLLRPGEGGVEETWGLESIDSDRPAARLEEKSGVLAGEGSMDGKPVRAELRSEGSGACAAKIEYGALNYTLELVQRDVPACQPVASAQVRFVGRGERLRPIRIRRGPGGWCRSGCGTRTARRVDCFWEIWEREG